MISSVFNTIQSALLESKWMAMQVDATLQFGCINKWKEAGYNGVVDSFTGWCWLNHLQLNTKCGNCAELKVPGSTYGQQAELAKEHRDCVQEGPELHLGLLSSEAPAIQYLQ